MKSTNSLLVVVAVVLAVGVMGMYWRAHRYDTPTLVTPIPAGIQTAYFAGGCFWCTEADFEKVPGVTAVISGYLGGHTEHPTYPQVVTETTGHRESVEVRYDPTRVDYATLVAYFFAHIDPTDAGGSFVDRGESYTSAIFYRTEAEQEIINVEIARLTKAGAYTLPIVTSVLPLSTFWPAEEYHQDYHTKNAVRYGYYRNASGRDQKIGELCAYRETKGVPCAI